MDLIYTNANKEDVGVLLAYDLDLAFGADENDFECRIQMSEHCCEAGAFLYIEGTEYGGIIDKIKSDTTEGEVVYYGRTWHGILDSKILEPDSGEAYLVVSGEANAVIGTLLERMGLSGLFRAEYVSSGLTISSYKMHRYVTGYDGIKKMLASVGGKLEFTYQDGMVILSAVPVHDYSVDEEFDSDQIGFEVTKKHNSVNHLVCLGSGELENRMVVHLYVDESGEISQTQTLFDLDEYSAVYDYSDVESEEELIKSGTSRLKELWEPDSMTIDFDSDSDIYDVGDVVGAVDNVTGINIYAEITKKIVTITNGKINISYKVGEE